MESLEKKYQNKTITEEELIKYRRIVLIKKILLESLYIFMIVFSLIRIKKNAVFYNVLGNGSFFSFYGIALVLFFITLYTVFVVNTYILGYVIYKKVKNEDFLPFLHTFNVKSDIFAFIFKCFSIMLFLLIYITTPCTVVGQSMENTFYDGDKLFCVDVFYTPKEGDVVVFDAEHYANEDAFFIKRVVGISGSVIKYDEMTSKTYVGAEVCDDISLSEYEIIRNSVLDGSTDLEFIIPEGYLLLLGDNRNNSKDSRSFGLVKEEDLLGKVFFRIFPITGISFY